VSALLALALALAGRPSDSARAAPAEAKVEVVVAFSSGERLKTTVSADELAKYTGQKLPYMIGTWIRAGLEKLGLPYVEAAHQSGQGKQIASIRGAANGESGRWVVYLDGVRLTHSIDTQLSSSVGVVLLSYELPKLD
jgi:hypothetical protein